MGDSVPTPETADRAGLAKDPAQRPGQALAFAAELERVAVQAYGPGWERIGRQVLVGTLTGLVPTGVLLSLVPGLGPATFNLPYSAVGGLTAEDAPGLAGCEFPASIRLRGRGTFQVSEKIG